jgi:hypothetical protein
LGGGVAKKKKDINRHRIENSDVFELDTKSFRLSTTREDASDRRQEPKPFNRHHPSAGRYIDLGNDNHAESTNAF